MWYRHLPPSTNPHGAAVFSSPPACPPLGTRGARSGARWLYCAMARISRDRDDVHIALLHGVNVGGTKKVPMLALRDLARGLGFGTPRTLLNSGNLVYAAHGTPTEEAAIALEQGILQHMKVSTRVVVVTAAELDLIIEENAIDGDDVDPSCLFVSIWRDAFDRHALLPLLEQLDLLVPPSPRPHPPCSHHPPCCFCSCKCCNGCSSWRCGCCCCCCCEGCSCTS